MTFLEVKAESISSEELVNVFKAFCRSYGFIWNDENIDCLKGEGTRLINKVWDEELSLCPSKGNYNFVGKRKNLEDSKEVIFIFGTDHHSFMGYKGRLKEDLKSKLFREELERLFPGKVKEYS